MHMPYTNKLLSVFPILDLNMKDNVDRDKGSTVVNIQSM
jgi:hypothetical protein